MTTRFTLLFLTAALAIPGVAAAKPGNRDFQRTFPVASRLCNAVADGHTPKRLQSSEAQITTACATLHADYDAAVSAAGPGVDALEQAIATAKSSAQAACAEGGDRQTCRAARKDARTSVRTARQAFRDVRRAYHEAIQTARKAFWTTIKGLRGGASLHPDRPQPNAPVPGEPADETVDES